jgi:hypothetical protein
MHSERQDFQAVHVGRGCGVESGEACGGRWDAGSGEWGVVGTAATAPTYHVCDGLRAVAARCPRSAEVVRELTLLVIRQGVHPREYVPIGVDIVKSGGGPRTDDNLQESMSKECYYSWGA